MSHADEEERSPLLKLPPDTVDAMRDSERVIARSRVALAPVLAHAENVLRFDTAIREAYLPVKKTYESAGLDYQLARHALWIAETVGGHEHEYPAIRNFGPSLVLVVREAARRLEREERADELPQLIGDIASGMPRSAVREKYLPPKPKRGAAAVLAAVRAGRMEAARRLHDECDDEGRGKLRLLAVGLALIVNARGSADASDPEQAQGRSPEAPPPAAGSIEQALREVAS